MNKIILETESYLTKNGENQRFFPFLELEYNEWVIYEDDEPKYFFQLSTDLKSESEIILYNSYLILRPALGEVMDEQLYDDLILEIREKSIEVKGVLDTEKCFIRKSGMKFHVDLHAIVNSEITVKSGHDIAHKLKDYLQNEIPNLGQVMIHIEPNE